MIFCCTACGRVMDGDASDKHWCAEMRGSSRWGVMGGIGCRGCGHAMVLEETRVRDLTSDEAETMAEHPEFPDFKRQREQFIKHLIG